MLSGKVNQESVLVECITVIETRGILDEKMRIEKKWDYLKFPSEEDISHAKWLGINHEVCRFS